MRRNWFIFILIAALRFGWADVSRASPVWHWSNPLPHGNDIIEMAYYNGSVYQVCDAGQIYSSSDLSFWQSLNSHSTNSLQAVTVFGNRLVVVGENGAVTYSDDGYNFVATNLATTDWLVGVAASSNLVVAVGDNAAIYTSNDGATWKRQAAPPSVGGNWLLSVAYGGGMFVTVGERGYIATSANGTNWTYRNLSNTNDLNYVTWITTQNLTNGFPTNSFLAVGNSRAIVSTNLGAAWNTPMILNLTNSMYSAAGNESSRLLAGDATIRLGQSVSTANVWREPTGSLLYTAPDWTYYSSLALPQTNTYALGGEAGLFAQSGNTNGNYLWNELGSSARDWLWSITTNSSLYVAVGDHARIMTSSDGVNWEIESINDTNSVNATNTVFFGVGGSTNLLVAVGSGGSLAVSTNNYYTVVTTNSDGSLSTNLVSSIGIVWLPLPAPTTNDLHGVGTLGSTYYISGGHGSIFSSGNGTSWVSRNSTVTTYLSSIETFSNTLVCVGDVGTILTSPDGVTWTKRTSGTTNWIYRVRNFNGQLIAVGENGTILTSSNATTWTARTSGTTSWLNDVQMVTNTYYIVGSLGTLLTSTNATTWTNTPIITDSSLYSAATMNGQLVTVGLEGIILRSQIIPDLTPPDILDFSTVDGQYTFLVEGDTDQSFTLDSTTNLINWTTGPAVNITDSDGSVLFQLDPGASPPTYQFFRATLTP